jgi:3-phosphoshikimate 1-carboxyvinyltransferase
MKYIVSHPTKKITGTIELTASKSESNRALIIQALCEEKFELCNLALAQDTFTMNKVLDGMQNAAHNQVIDVGSAGTTMRFLTAYCASKPGLHLITGSERMKKRPIGILVNALRDLGAQIEYEEEEGFPPLRITGKPLRGGVIEMDGSISSQYISAILLISPVLENGLTINFKGSITSRPYINMTLKMMEYFGVKARWEEKSLTVGKQQYTIKKLAEPAYTIEADWSAASYWYAIAALSEEADIVLKGLKKNSLQGDSVLVDLFTFFGVKTEFIPGGISITKTKFHHKEFGFDFSDCPDLAQTVAVAVSALKIPSLFNGLHTLKIKETDRAEALKVELNKIGTVVEIISDEMINIKTFSNTFNPEAVIDTYEDHRMAMAFAPLALTLGKICINHPDVVKKSYPEFWNDLKSVGFEIQEVTD